MKVLALVILAIGSAAALRSGPYLPSGWRPQGPAFFLPGEVEKSEPKAEQESEPSGSDFLREYGPPKQSEDLTKQDLPEIVTEQAFAVIRGSIAESKDVAIEANAELKSSVQETTDSVLSIAQEVTNAALSVAQEEQNADLKVTQEVVELTTSAQDATESLISENPTTEAFQSVVEEKLEQIVESSTAQDIQEELTTEKVLEAIVEAKALETEVQEKSDEIAVENVGDNVVSLSEQKLENVVDAQAEVNNIAEAIANLENEIKAVQVESQQVIEAKVEENAGSLEQVPEGFLEYGPPGFREYGPPKEAIVEEIKVENNENRKRRFSPKFKSTKAH